MILQKLSLEVRRGATNDVPIRVESSEWGYASISAMSQAAPLQVTAAGHAIPDGWRAAIMNATGGMSVLNAANSPPRDSDLRPVVRVDVNTVEFNAVNAAGLKAYAGGGQLAFRVPVDLSAYVHARMEVKTEVGGDRLALFATAGGVSEATDGALEIDAANDALRLRLTPAQAALLVFDSGVFDIELIRANGDVRPLCTADSEFVVLPETTTAE